MLLEGREDDSDHNEHNAKLSERHGESGELQTPCSRMMLMPNVAPLTLHLSLGRCTAAAVRGHHMSEGVEEVTGLRSSICLQL